MKNFKLTIFVLFHLLICGVACGEEPSAVTIPVTLQTTTQNLSVTAEIADTDAEREQGLMNRKTLDTNAGMLFVFSDDALRSFWMHNTYVSLDMIFVSTAREIIHIEENTTPLSDAPISSGEPAQYVLEVNAGWSALHGVSVGDTLNFTLP